MRGTNSSRCHPACTLCATQSPYRGKRLFSQETPGCHAADCFEWLSAWSILSEKVPSASSLQHLTVLYPLHLFFVNEKAAAPAAAGKVYTCYSASGTSKFGTTPPLKSSLVRRKSFTLSECRTCSSAFTKGASALSTRTTT